MVCPSTTIRRTSAGYRTTLRPTRQKVALTPAFLSKSRILGVFTGSGPSSNVSATAVPPVASIEPWAVPDGVALPDV